MSLSPSSQEPLSPSPQAIVAAQAIIQAARALQAAIMASLCILIYDAGITFDQEVKYVWLQRWSFGKTIYIFIRYATILLMIGHVTSMLLFNPSQNIEEIFVWSQVVILIAGSSVLVVRTWLLWGGRKWVLVSLLLGLALVSVLSIISVFADITDFIIVPNRAPSILPGCLVRIPSTAWRPFVFPLLYETLIVVLTVIKVSATRTRAPVVMRLFLDGTLYYIVVVTVLLVTTVGAAHPRTRPVVVGSGFHTACVSVGCSRLFLSLHSWSEKNKDRSTPNVSSLHTSKRSYHSRSDSTSSGSIRPPQPVFEYELTTRSPAGDIEAARVTVDSSDSAAELLRPSSTTLGVHSILPDIERPSLPERVWYSQARYQQQRPSRPPRSSSLYTSVARTGMVSDLQKPSISSELSDRGRL